MKYIIRHFVFTAINPDWKPDVITRIDERERGAIQGFFLHAFPNPFKGQTTISYSLEKESKVQLKVLDAMGNEVIILRDEIQKPGKSTIPWNGNNVLGKQVQPGNYFLVLISIYGKSVHKVMKIH